MTLPTFPPADQCSPETLLAIAEAVGRHPALSYDLAGSREHIEAICRLAVGLAQDLSEMTTERDTLQSHIDVIGPERFDAEVALASARTEIRALQSTLDHERNERQGEVLRAEADRERADAGEAAAEVFEVTARAALAILARDRGAQPVTPVSLEEIVRAIDGRLSRALVRMVTHDAMLSVRLENALRQLEELQQTLHHNDRIQSAMAATCEAVTGKTIEQVNLELDEELAANPDLGPLDHARDMRDPEDQPVLGWNTISAALTPCEHRPDVPCAGCEMARRRTIR